MACRILIGDGNGLGATWLDHMKRTEAERQLHPQRPAEMRGPRAYFGALQDPETPPAQNGCKHRWFPGGRCVRCGAMREEVLA